MLQKHIVFLIISLIGLSFFGVIFIRNQQLQKVQMIDTTMTLTPDVTIELSSTPTPTNTSGTNAYYCDQDSDCGLGRCVEDTMCPPCLDGDPYAKCTCVTVKRCQFN